MNIDFNQAGLGSYLNLGKVQTKLKGYDGPIFPKEIDVLDKVYYDLYQLGLVSEKLGCKRNINEITEDGYIWLGSLHFESHFSKDKEIVLMFPDWEDSDRFYGCERRSIAVYTKGKIQADKISKIINKVRNQLISINLQ